MEKMNEIFNRVTALEGRREEKRNLGKVSMPCQVIKGCWIALPALLNQKASKENTSMAQLPQLLIVNLSLASSIEM